MRLIARGDADGLACAVFITIMEKLSLSNLSINYSIRKICRMVKLMLHKMTLFVIYHIIQIVI